MNLLTYLLAATSRWAAVFPQERSLQRAIALAFGILCGVGRRTVTRAISFHGNTQKEWSADYKVFSRSLGTARLVPAHSGAGHPGAKARTHRHQHG